MFVNYGGSQISCSDSANSSLVIFFRGCKYRCGYCQNKELQSGENYVDIEDIKREIENNFLVSEVIFSGGEPTMQLGVLRELATFCKSRGLKVGVETSGYNSFNFWTLLHDNLIDEVFLDIKTYGEENYEKLTGYKDSWIDAGRLAIYCSAMKIPTEIRTTIIGNFPGQENLQSIENVILNGRNFKWKKQEGRCL